VFIGRAFPDLANDLQRHRTVLVHVVPFESNLQALRHAIVSQALNPTVVNRVVFKGQRVDVFTIHDPMPTTGTPVVQWSTSWGFASNWLVFTI
jgi:hypothetical protein